MSGDFGLDVVLVQDRSIVGSEQPCLASLLLWLGATLSALFTEAHSIARLSRRAGYAEHLYGAEHLPLPTRSRLCHEPSCKAICTFAGWQDKLRTGPCEAHGIGDRCRRWILLMARNALLVAIYDNAAIVVLEPLFGCAAAPARHTAGAYPAGWRILASRMAWYGYGNAD